MKQLEVRLRGLDDLEGRVGWFPSAVYPDGTPVAYVAAIQEYGTKGIPPRLGMRETVSERKAEWRRVASVVSKRVLAGKMTGNDAMLFISQTGEDDLADHISHVSAPPLSEITLVARKMRQDGKKVTGATIGHIAAELAAGKSLPMSANTKPLNDTGYLLATLSHAVVKT